MTNVIEAVRDFGSAVSALKNGYKLARTGWNGEGMFIYLNPGSSETLTPEQAGFIGGVSEKLFELGQLGTVTRMPNINMRAADGTTITGWLASQTDILAEDWTVVSE